MRVQRILESSLYVADLDAAVRWYQRVLGAELHTISPGEHAFFRIGDGMLLLFVAKASRDQSGEIPPHGCDGEGHLAFAITHEELSVWERQLDRAGVEIERVIDWPHGARSLYFRDPSHNSIELATDDLWSIPPSA